MKRTRNEIVSLVNDLHYPSDTRLNPNGLIYLSGPISGYSLRERRKTFEAYEHALIEEGWYVINPMKNDVPFSAPHHAHMRADIAMMMHCKSIYFMPGWEESDGCKLELQVARACGLEFIQPIPAVENRIAMNNMKGE